jgi:hypothetical protein
MSARAHATPSTRSLVLATLQPHRAAYILIDMLAGVLPCSDEITQPRRGSPLR